MMSKLPAKETALADRLRQEALTARPAFSEDRHARLCAAVRCCPAEAVRPLPTAGSRWTGWASLAAAACLLLAVGATWMLMRAGPQDRAGGGSSGGAAYAAHRGASGPAGARRKADMRSMNALVDQVSTKFDGFVDLAVQGPWRFYLDRGLRAALQTPVVRVPVDVVSSLLSMTPQKRPRPSPAAGRS
jgi:hypothetical protein